MLELELQTARQLARAAGQAVMKVYRQDMVITEKPDGLGPVTIADLQANAIIVSGLEAAFPGDGMLSEEIPDTPKRLKKSRVWCVDPIDGTKDFLAQNGEFAVQIGLIEDKRPVLGIVFLPAKNLLYFGGPGIGAFLEQEGTTRPVTAGGKKPVTDLVIVNSRFHRGDAIQVFMRHLGITHERVHGSIGGKAGLIARGEADLFLYAAPHVQEWDVCAPHAILAGSGGTIIDCLGRDLTYNQPDPHCRYGVLGLHNANYPSLLEKFKCLMQERYGIPEG